MIIHKDSNKSFRLMVAHYQILTLKKNFMVPFHGWGLTASRLEPLRWGSLLSTTKFPEIPGTHLSQTWNHPLVLNTGPLDWESSTLTTRPLLPVRLFNNYASNNPFSWNWDILIVEHTEFITFTEGNDLWK